MMANGGLDRLMSNPAMRNMVCPAKRAMHLKTDHDLLQAERMQSGGGMPDMESLRNDPEMRKLAEDMMGGAGAPGAGRGA